MVAVTLQLETKHAAVLCLFYSYMSFSDVEAVFSTKMQANAIRNVGNQLHTSCVYLTMSAQSDMSEKLMLVNIAKHLGMFMAVLTSKMIQQSLESFNCRRIRPLHVVMDADPSTINMLETISSEPNVDEMHWLVLSEHNMDLEAFLDKVDIPLDCQLLFLSDSLLVEAFRVGEHVKVIPAGTRTDNGALRWHRDFLSRTFYERRANLMGTVIRTAAQFEGTAGAFIRRDNGKTMEFGGFFVNLWRELGSRLNFTSEYIIPGDHGEVVSWGKQLDMVMKGEVEVALGAFIMTHHLLDHVRFLLPLGKTSVAVFVKAPTSPFSTNWNGYLAPFTHRLWQTFLIVIFMLVLGLTFTYRIGIFIGNAEAEETVFIYGLQESFLCVLGSFCQQGQERTPRSWPCRLVYFTSYLTAVVVMAAYAATFISFLTVKQVYLPFTTFDELLHKSNFYLGAVNKSLELSFFQNATEEVLKELYKKKMAPYLKNSPAHYLEGFQKICDIPNYGFVCDTIQHLLLHQEVQCLVLSVPQAAIPASGTFVISRESRFRRILNNNLANMKESGELKRLFLKSIPAAVAEDKADDSLKPSVRLEEVVPALAFLAGSMILSCIILLLERCTHRLVTSGCRRRPLYSRRTCRQCYLQESLLRRAILPPPPECY